MYERQEDYAKYLQGGIALTLLLVLLIAVYSVGETARLERAAESFTARRVQRGQVIYAEQCAACHGAQGEGDSGPALNNRSVLKNTLDNVFFSVVRSGVPGTSMPAWSVDFGGPLTDEDVRDVVAYMRAWEPTAPEIQPVSFVPDAGRGAILFSSTCAVCHGEDGLGGDQAPKINDLQRLSSLDDDWYRAVIRNGRPAKGMPTWGTVLSPDQIEDLLALIESWRAGIQVPAEFSVTSLLEAAIYSLREGDAESAGVQIERALQVADGAGAEVLHNASVQLDAGDAAGAQATLQALLVQWPLGNPATGAAVYSASCSACHGAQGEGGIGNPLVDNPFMQSLDNADLVDFLLVGRPGTAMAGFEGRLSQSEIADLVAFLRLWQE